MKNLTIKNSSVYAESSYNGYVYSRAYAGAICGIADRDSTISNCVNLNTSVKAAATDIAMAGGILGCSDTGGNNTSIRSCRNSGQIRAISMKGLTRTAGAGGILGGYSHTASISSCTNTGSVSVDDSQMASGQTGEKGDIVGVVVR